ncbi:MAG: hypothetical protein R3F39_03205 [Myxococcota bacterium]
MPFVAGNHLGIANALHVLALTRRHHALASGYAREDARLRSALRQPPARLAPDDALRSPEDALAGALPTLGDQAWFATRWAAGESEGMAAHAARLAEEANALPHGGLLPADATVLTLVSPALGRAPVSIASPWCAVASPRAPAIALVLSAVAAGLAPALPPLDLEPREAALLQAMLAASAIHIALATDEALDPWLPTIAATWLPAPSDVGIFMATIHRIARQALDQPPGEVDRIASGLAVRRISRLQRAVRRGFFSPRGFDLEAWVRARL